ncbi:peptidase s41 family protein [Colletotrichum karsti]|uniref:Peptidase s41 family protein n=1 Tax=Colletotrichum karsti TaxID=1095194 RepID=A0A9P6LDH9_9PEZI|nr:peptidase s41 family protein [Colletotrichum karsti]KAF9871754.1 peptidase s41 family protein [Colletotrichum karsti]
MRSSLTWALALVGTATAANLHAAQKANANANDKPTPTSAPNNACSLAKAAAESNLAANPSATAAFITPSLAYNCLYSVPVDKERDLDLLNYLEPYLQFQSTLEILANPPEGYLIPGVDVIAGIGQIRAKLSKNQYKSQLDFALELKQIFYQAADGHFAYNPAILSVFGFGSHEGLVSVADKVTGLPTVYLESGFQKSIVNDTDVYDIESIDGIEICEFIESHAARLQTQDPDAKYNMMFPNPATIAKGGHGAFTGRLAGSTPDQEVIKFTNGSTYVNKLYATVHKSSVPFLNSAEELHNEFEVPSPPTSTTARSSPATTVPVVPVTPVTPVPSPTSLIGYPEPVAFHEHSWISGYFLDGEGYKDTAVLAVLAFSPWMIDAPNGTFEIIEAQRTVAEFLQKSKKAGKKKLIIDVQTNGGGLIVAGFQLYSQLFPKATDIWDGNRIRANEALKVIGGVAEETSPKYYKDFIGSTFDEERKPFKDFAALFGPEYVGSQNVTNLLRYDPEYLGLDTSDEEQVFDAEDIVILTDGSCASTCTIFTGLMVREQGVRTIALGGRPMEAAMQAIGGVEGSQVFKYQDVRQFVRQTSMDAAKTNNTEAVKAIKDAWDVIPDLGEPPLLPTLIRSGSINYRNAYPRKDVNGYPAHFTYEAANCRLFYTEKMIVDPVAVWTAGYDAAWKKGKCVARSTANTDSTIGDKTVPYSAGVKSRVAAYTGPGALTYKGAYEPCKPFYQKKGNQKREVEDADLLPPDDFVYEFRHKIGGQDLNLDEYIKENVPEGWEYEERHKIGEIAQAVDF